MDNLKCNFDINKNSIKSARTAEKAKKKNKSKKTKKSKKGNKSKLNINNTNIYKINNINSINKINSINNYNNIYIDNSIMKLKFVAYNGPRWTIPSGITVSPSIKLKFDKVSIYKITEVIKKINQESFNSIFSFSINDKNSDFYKITDIETYLISLRDKEKNEWKKVVQIYSKIFKLVRFMNKLVFLRRINICMKKQINTEDIVTMEVPKKPIYVINYPKRCTYVYEADTLKKAIDNRLLISEWMFDNAQIPINLLSNEPFTIGQSISIYNQMKAYGIFSWIFDRFKAYEFNLKKFRLNFKQQLKLEAIKSHFKNEIENSRETVIEFFEANAINQGVHQEDIERFKIYYKLYPNSSHNRTLAPLVKRHYIAYELNDPTTLLVITLEIVKFIDRYLNSI
jgi:hypothetical protein